MMEPFGADPSVDRDVNAGFTATPQLRSDFIRLVNSCQSLVLSERMTSDCDGLYAVKNISRLLAELKRHVSPMSELAAIRVNAAACLALSRTLCGLGMSPEKFRTSLLGTFSDFLRTVSAAAWPADEVRDAPSQPEIIAHIHRLISSRCLEDTFSIAEAASLLHVSQSHLQHIVRRHTGSTFCHLLRLARIRCAERLIGSTNLSMKEIAFKVGFGSVAGFNRAFRRVHRYSPTDWARKVATPPLSRN